MLWNYAFLNRGLTLTLNGKPFKSENGLKDLLQKNLSGEPLYPIIHLEGDDIEIAITHGSHYGEEYFSFVNGQHTTMGGTHLQAFREAFVDTLRNFYKRDFDAADVRQSIVAAVSVRVHGARLRVADQDEARLERRSARTGPRSRSSSASSSSRRSTSTCTRTRRRPTPSSGRIQESEHERKELAGIRSLARERAKKASLHNRKLRDCRLHLGDKDERARGQHALHRRGRLRRGLAHRLPRRPDAGRLRPQGQAAQHLRPLEEGDLRERGVPPPPVRAQHRGGARRPALRQGRDRDRRRRGRDAHPPAADLVLPAVLPRADRAAATSSSWRRRSSACATRRRRTTATPRRRRQAAVAKLGRRPPRSPASRAWARSPPASSRTSSARTSASSPLSLDHLHNSDELLSFFMGKNTPERQDFIIDNLRVEKDVVEA